MQRSYGCQGCRRHNNSAGNRDRRKKRQDIRQSGRKTPGIETPTDRNAGCGLDREKREESFRTVIKRWAKRVGHTVIVDTSDAWTIAVPVRLEGDFKTAVSHLVRGLSMTA